MTQEKALATQDITSIAGHFIKSGFFRDAKDQSQAIVKILAGQEIGVGPFTAMTGINIIQGRIAMSANLIAAQVKRSGKYNFHVKVLTDTECALEFFEGGKLIGVSTFTSDDATQAKLAGVNWTNYPRNMLFARAISNGAKWYCPDVFGGSPVYTPEELGAPVNPETGEIIEGTVITPEPTKAHSQEEPWPATKVSNLTTFMAWARDAYGYNDRESLCVRMGVEKVAQIIVMYKTWPDAVAYLKAKHDSETPEEGDPF